VRRVAQPFLFRREEISIPMAYVTSILAGIAAAAPLLTSVPLRYQAIASGVIATAGALYHLFQPVPVSK
jgi:hypothetical protein